MVTPEVWHYTFSDACELPSENATDPHPPRRLGHRSEQALACQRTRGSVGRYVASAPTRIENHADLISSIRCQIGDDGTALVGFDFPIGIPAAYAGLAGVREFKSFLRKLGHGEWAEFYNVAMVRSEISVRRPFYPFRPGGTRQAQLLKALGLNEIDDFRRECEKKQPGRRAACPLFWTLGANQVGKGAIVGWRDVLAPNLRDGNSVFLWPFDGNLEDLLKPGKTIIVETYPAECYGWFLPKPLKGKGKLEVRRSVSESLLTWAKAIGIELGDALRRKIEGDSPRATMRSTRLLGCWG